MRLKSSFHNWFIHTISPTWIRGLQVGVENLWHLHSLKGSSTDTESFCKSPVLSPVRSVLHTTERDSALCCLLGAPAPALLRAQFTTCCLVCHVQHHQGQDEEWPFQLHLFFLFSAYFIWVLWLLFLAPVSVSFTIPCFPARINQFVSMDVKCTITTKQKFDFTQHKCTFSTPLSPLASSC